MRALTSLPVLTILALSLTGCGPRQTAPIAAADRGPEINRQLAARCPTPGRLTALELRSLAADLDRGVARHWQRAAAEYDRLDDEARVCRTGRAP